MRKYFSKDKWRYMLYTISHPMDGFYWIRHQERGSVPLALLMVLLFSASFTFNRLVSSFVVNDIDPRAVDSVYELFSIAALFLLLCVSNWSITCLMSGEGRLKDIAIAVGYGTVPMTFVLTAATILSKAVSDDEEVFYWMLIALGIAYGIILMLIGIMQVHNYTLGKTLLTLLLTILALFIIIFLLLLLSNLIGAVVNFFRSIYTELIFRT